MKTSTHLHDLDFHLGLLCREAFPFYVKSTGMAILFQAIHDTLKAERQ